MTRAQFQANNANWKLITIQFNQLYIRLCQRLSGREKKQQHIRKEENKRERKEKPANDKEKKDAKKI